MTGCRLGVARPRRDEDRGSTLPLMIGFFLIAGLMLTGGVSASAAFLAQRDLQSGCDGAAIAAAQGFTRTSSGDDPLTFDQAAAEAGVATYAPEAWGGDAASVSLTVGVDGNVVQVTCSRTVRIPFDSVFSPGGIRRTATSTADAPPIG